METPKIPTLIQLIERLPLPEEKKQVLRRNQHLVYRFTIPVIVLLTLFIVGWITLALLINEKRIAQDAQIYLEAQTSRQWNTGKKIDVSFFPSPKVTIHKVQLSNDYRSEEPYFMRASRMVIHLGWGALFESQPMPEKVVLDRPEVLLEVYRDGFRNWSFLEKVMHDTGPEKPVDIVFQNGEIQYYNALLDRHFSMDPFSGELIISNQLNVSIKGKTDGMSVTFKAACDTSALQYPQPFKSQCDVSYKEDQNQYGFKGEVDFADEAWGFAGNVNVNAPNVSDTLYRWWWVEHQKEHEELTLPLILTGELTLNEKTIALKANQFSSGETRGAFNMAVQMPAEDEQPTGFDLSVALEKLHITKEKGGDLGFVSFLLKRGNGALVQTDSVEGEAEITIKDISVKEKNVASNFSMMGAWEGRVLNVSALKSDLVNGAVSSVGYIYSSTESLQASLKMKAKGENFGTFFKEADIPLPEVGVDFAQPYELSSQVVLRGDSVSVSNLESTLGDATISGGVNYIAAEGKRPIIESGLQTKNIELSPIIAVWQGETSVFDYPANIKGTNPYLFEWLREPRFDVDLQLEMENMLPEWDEVSSVKGRITVREDKFEVGRIQGKLGESTLAGSVLLSLGDARDKPRIISNLIFSDFSLDHHWAPYLFKDEAKTGLTGKRNNVVKESIWAEQRISMVPLNHFDGNGDIRIGKFTFQSIDVSNLRTKWQLKDNAVTFSRGTGRLYDGELGVAATFKSGEVPSMGMNVTLQDYDIEAMFEALLNVKSIGGVASLGMQLKTGGITTDGWVNNLEGSINVSARNMKVEGVNINGVAKQVKAKPNVRQLTKVVNEVYQNGSTVFDRADMNLLIKNGAIKPSKWLMSSRSAVGKITGDFDISTMLAAMELEAKLITLGSSAPDLLVEITGPAGALSHKVNTVSIERYITRQVQ